MSVRTGTTYLGQLSALGHGSLRAVGVWRFLFSVGLLIASTATGAAVGSFGIGGAGVVVATAVVAFSAVGFARSLAFLLIAETILPVFSYRVHFLAAGAPVGIGILSMLILSLFWARVVVRETGRQARWNSLDAAVFGYVVICIVSALMSSDVHVASAGFRDQLKFFVVYLCVRAAAPTLSATTSRRLGRMIFGLLVFVAVAGILEYFLSYGLLARFGHFPRAFSDQYMGTGRYSPNGGGYFVPQHRRLYSTLANPLFTAYAAAGGAIMTAAMVAGGSRRRVRTIALFILFLLCIALTYSRSAIVGVVGGLFVVLLVTPATARFRAMRARSLAAIAASFALVIALLAAVSPALLRYPLSILSSDAVTTSGHYRYLSQDWRFLTAHPLGAGIGRASLQVLSSDPTSLATWTESWFFYVSGELGVAGLAVFLLICVLAIRRLLGEVRRVTAPLLIDRWLVSGTAGWFVALLVAGVGGVPFFNWMVSASCWTLVALVVNQSDVPEMGEEATNYAFIEAEA